MSYRPTQFTLDAIENAVFEGYRDMRSWNGFACPAFLYEEAVRILNLLKDRTSDETLSSWQYDENQDTFILENAIYDEPELIRGEMIEVEGKLTRVYPLGAYSWSWLEA